MNKKILYLVTQSDFGGAQRYVYDLATNISDNFSVIVASGEQGYDGELAKNLQTKNVKYIYLHHVKRAINPYHDFLAFWQIKKLIKQEKPDVVHLNSSKISILGSLANKSIVNLKSKIKIVYTVHGWVFNENLNYFKKLIYKILERFTARFKDKIICLSEFEKNNTINNKIAPTEKISVIYNGREQINFLTREQAREKLGIPKDAVAIGSIGNLYKNKGYEYLIKSMNRLQIADCRLQIIGEGLESNNLKSEIRNQKLDDKIKIMGNISDAAKFLHAFDIYVCSSIKEGLPYTILEAMQAGLPIVSTNVGAIPEIITDSENGLLVEPKNPKQLAEKIQYLINNPEIAKRLGENAKEKVKKFSLEKMVKKTEEIYDK